MENRCSNLTILPEQIHLFNLTCTPNNFTNFTTTTNLTTNLTTTLLEHPSIPLGWADVAMLFLFFIIFMVGVVGNLLVVILILRFPQMRTITNMYLFNLAVCDFFYLWGIPITATTLYYRKWVFGNAMCKLFYTTTACNMFANVFIVTVLSADRYIAVCKSRVWSHYRSLKVSVVVCVVVWLFSMLCMLPINLYAYVNRSVENGILYESCTLDWTWEKYNLSSEKLFVLYAFTLSFAIPVPLVSFFYLSVLITLAKAANHKSASQVKRSQKRVTVMVLSVITAFVVSWLPYWVYQGLLIFSDFTLKSLFSFLTILNYANSALNPLLYAFLSQTFRKNLDNLMRCTGEQHPAATNTVALKTLEGTNDEDKQNIKSSVRRLKSEA